MRDADTRVPTGLGVAIEQARQSAGLSMREAAERAGFAAATWTNMIRGGSWLKLGGIRRFRPHRPTDETVRAAATAVGMDVSKALKLPRDAVIEQSPSVGVDLSEVPTDDLWEELRRRIA